MDAFIVAVAAIGGLLFGSFANVAIHRVPRRESVIRPASRCPACGTPIAPRDNIPLISWALLRGRCRECRAPIAARYPAIEALTGLLFTVAALRVPDPRLVEHTRWDLLAILPFLLVLVVLSGIDLEHRILPNRVVLPAAATQVLLLAAAAGAGPGPEAWGRALVAGGACFASLLILALIAPRGMGMGDVKMAGLIGLPLGYLGWGYVLVGFFLAFAIGAGVGLLLIATRRAGMKSQVPFGPSLAAGAALAILYGGPILDRWLG